jgi:hypothetical protein
MNAGSMSWHLRSFGLRLLTTVLIQTFGTSQFAGMKALRRGESHGCTAPSAPESTNLVEAHETAVTNWNVD